MNQKIKEFYNASPNIDFWTKYIEADYFERKELIASLPLIKSIIKMRMQNDIDEELFTYCVNSYVQSYIDDCILVAQENAIKPNSKRF